MSSKLLCALLLVKVSNLYPLVHLLLSRRVLLLSVKYVLWTPAAHFMPHHCSQWTSAPLHRARCRTSSSAAGYSFYCCQWKQSGTHLVPSQLTGNIRPAGQKHPSDYINLPLDVSNETNDFNWTDRQDFVKESWRKTIVFFIVVATKLLFAKSKIDDFWKEGKFLPMLHP